MDGQSGKILVWGTLLLVVLGSASALGQAMGKAVVADAEMPGTQMAAPAVAPVRAIAAPAPAAPAPGQGPAIPSPAPAPAASTPVEPAAVQAGALAPAPLPESLPVVPRAEAPRPTLATESKTSDSPEPRAVKPEEATAGAASKPSIENTRIRSNAASATQTGAADTGNKKTGATGFSSAYGGLPQVITALAVVIGLILIGKAMAKKFVPGAKGGSGKGVIEILARHPLAKNQSIVLVRIGSQIVALNQGRESSESVLVISDATEVAKIIGQIEGRSPDSISSGFNKLLANARMDLEETPQSEEPELRNNQDLDEQLEEMAAAKRQLMELRQHVRSVRDRLPRD
jgi:flagellar biogenesis protein FliO